MKFWRALLMPLHPTSLVLVAFIAAAFALVNSVAIVGVLRLLPELLLLSWVFKYAYAMLEQAAEGIFTAPVPSVDTLGPFEWRPLMQLALCLFVWQLHDWLPRLPGQVVIGLWVLLLPASAGALGVTRSALEAANPVILLRIVKGMGMYYLLIVALIVGCSGVAIVLYRLSAWTFLLAIFAALSLLSVYAGIGGGLYERRLKLGHEPRSSPERTAEREYREYVQRRNTVIDEVYYPIRIGNLNSAAAVLRDWLSTVSVDRLGADVDAVMTSALEWKHERGLQLVTRCLVVAAIGAGKCDAAMEAVTLAWRAIPTLSLESEEDTIRLGLYARSVGRRSAALTLIRNFELSHPAQPLGKELSGLRQELQP